ncbi:hypothetical protein FF2_014069 [Malus domestica]
MIANKYYRRFTDLSRYHLEVATNSIEMLRHFRLGSRKKWRSMVTTSSCATYQEFYDILLQIEDSENMPSESEKEEKDGNQKKDDKGVIIGTVVGSVGEAVADAILVVKWGIGLSIVLRISRGPNSLPYHHHC